MPTVRDQDKDYPFYSHLAEFFDSRVDVADTDPVRVFRLIL
jgi:hypothetical protein